MTDPRTAALLAAVTARAPVDGRERASRERILAACRPSPVDPFDNAAPSHFTASAIVISAEGVLLHFHKRLQLWLQPGGHIEAAELPHESALREVREETGLLGRHHGDAPALLHVDVHRAGPHLHYDLRYLVDATGQPAPGPEESQQVRWFAWDEAKRIADPGLIGALIAAEQRLARSR